MSCLLNQIKAREVRYLIIKHINLAFNSPDLPYSALQAVSCRSNLVIEQATEKKKKYRTDESFSLWESIFNVTVKLLLCHNFNYFDLIKNKIFHVILCKFKQ